jgi:hypothetical protein
MCFKHWLARVKGDNVLPHIRILKQVLQRWHTALKILKPQPEPLCL